MSDSDADDGGFDREAERERLREKYERDKEKRESTERMSELLLQGATMTNRHCDACGDPIFRYQGQEFCPTCQDAAQAEAETESQTGSEGGATTQSGSASPRERGGEPGQPTAPGADAASGQEADENPTPTPDPNGEPQSQSQSQSASNQSSAPPSEPNAAGAPGASEPETPPAEPADSAGSDARDQTEGARAADRTPETDSRAARQPAPAPDRDRARSGSAGAREREGVAAARASLERTLADLAARAEESRDVGQTRDLLAATREAAETLRELDRV